jgi:hypothetical protein
VSYDPLREARRQVRSVLGWSGRCGATGQGQGNFSSLQARGSSEINNHVKEQTASCHIGNETSDTSIFPSR